MEYTGDRLLQTKADLTDAVRELLQSRSRILMLVTAGISLVWWVGAATSDSAPLARAADLTTLIALPTCALALWLIARQFLAAQSVWLVGLAVAFTLAVLSLQEPVIGLLYVLLPLMAVVTVGWPAGLVAECAVIGLVYWLSHSPSTPPLPAPYGLGIALGGSFTGLLGWIATSTLLTVTRWSLLLADQACAKVEEARDRTLELAQTREDLLQANRELAGLSDRLKAMHQLADEARRAKEEFVANVSHELRTPLNMIIGFSEMITEAPQVYGDHVPPTLLADIRAIQRNSQHLAKLVDDVLDLSQVEARRMALIKEWASPQDIIGAATLAVRPLFESKGLRLEIDVSPDLPQVFCDRTRIRQVLLNLLSNAGRFTERGGVRLKARREVDDIVVSVADTGPGIAPQDREKIFEPFHQADSSIRRRHSGSGLGLSIAKRFVESHGGKMWLESGVGAGTTIAFSLPLDTSLFSELDDRDSVTRWFHPYDQYTPRTRRPRAPAPDVLPRFVLLEKEDTLRRLFSRYLHGFETVSVRGIESAIRELQRVPAQALVVNASPAAGGISASKDQLADLPYGTPAITCWVPGEEEAATRIGVARYLVKPVTRGVLLSSLRDLGERVRKVLLVDDERETLRLFARMLASQDWEYSILRATNGQRALSLLRQRQPDAMVLDLIMPGMDGFQVLREKALDPTIREIPVIVISAKDPSGEPVVSDSLTVTRSGGLSVRALLDCILALSEALSPSAQSVGRAQPEKPAA